MISKTNADDLANPMHIDNVVHELGLTKREYFAAMAMQGILAKTNFYGSSLVGQKAVEHADELTKALNAESDNG